LSDPALVIANVADDFAGAPHLTVHADAVGTYRVLVTIPAAKAPAGSTPISFFVVDDSGREITVHESAFVGPNR
jgi:hypothetical protein